MNNNQKMRVWHLPLSDKTPPLSLNKRMSWQQEYRITKRIKQEIFWQAKSKKLPKLHGQKPRIRLVYVPSANRRRDPSNMQPTQKAAIDGLTEAGIIRDDSPDHIQEQLPYVSEPIRGAKTRLFLEIYGIESQGEK